MDYSPLGRRSFLKASVTAGFGLVIPALASCETKITAGIGDAMPNIVLGSLTGDKVVIPAAFSGRVAILHFWAGWCSACREEMRVLETVFRKYSNQCTIPCSIGLGENRETAMRFIKNMDINYPVLFDPDSLTQRQFGISGIPAYYVLSRQGIIRFKILGEADKNGWDKIIRTLI